MKSKLQYYFSTNENDDESYIEEDEGDEFTPNGVPSHGWTAWTRFFCHQNTSPKYVVKQPKPDKVRALSDLRDQKLNNEYNKRRYQHELDVWNLVHPGNKAYLFTDNGIRLVLPYLPGKTLFSFISREEDQLTWCQLTHAVFSEFKRFTELGLKHCDVKYDNFLIERKQDGTFRAYIIDLDSVGKLNPNDHDYDWNIVLAFLFDDTGLKSPDVCPPGYIALKSIDTPVENEFEARSKLDGIKKELSQKKPTLIRIKSCLQNELYYYFVYGCLYNGQWGFTKLDENIISSVNLSNFSGSLTDRSAACVIGNHIKSKQGHISYRLDLYINCLNEKITELTLLKSQNGPNKHNLQL
ncbi:hypothetical protein OQJ02_09865 [Legionella sp. PATHC032]|uniref:hypothetical protein n=1 Tax=Legionella sp. PATHC032 TaxID=2992039 RepID=UPI001B1960A7|nr:hypothetical protein [Legionella sp. PATHC032]MCW8421937.1 hypothetical protein [Legionella sp. PATHC032]HAZ7572224.1 hypothetical protein [Legionella pneumophila]HBA1634752.1 hypothetical protein [Legionella pneumophila]